MIFFICSAWFLLESKKINPKKILYIIANVWVINILVLIIFKIIGLYEIPISSILKCLLPTTFDLNWYITYYLLFYCIHLGLNKIINSLTKKKLLIICVVMMFLYFGIDFIQGVHFAYTDLVCFISVYFVIAYIKLYLPQLSNDKKKNLILLTFGIGCTIASLLLINFLGYHIEFFSDKLLHWRKNNNPFLLIIGITLFNLFRQKKISNDFINYISGLTMLIYIIHENLFVREYLRPIIWNWIYNNIGYSYIVILDLVFALLLFVVSMIFAWFYARTLQKNVYKICDYFYKKLSKVFNLFTDKILKFD